MSEIAEIKLEACPSPDCGRSRYIEILPRATTGMLLQAVCMACDVRGPAKFTEQEAAEAWNRMTRVVERAEPVTWFPVLDGGYRVPWAFVEPHEPQAFENHRQTLKRIAERGGLSWSELYYVLKGRKWPLQSMISEDDAKAAVLKQLREFEQARSQPDAAALGLLSAARNYIAEACENFRITEAMPDGSIPDDEVREAIEKEEAFVGRIDAYLAQRDSE